MCIHEWMEVATAIFLNENVSNCGKKKLGRYDRFADLPGKAFTSAGTF